MEAGTRPPPPKSSEGEKRKTPADSENWRAKRRVVSGESDDESDEEASPPPKKVERPSEKSVDKVKPAYKRDMPYKQVKPVNTGERVSFVPDKRNSPLEPTVPTGEKSYRIRAPIQREGVTDEVIDQIHNTEVTVKLGDLFGLSRELREGERVKLTKVRQPVAPKGTEAVSWQEEVSPGEEEPLPTE